MMPVKVLFDSSFLMLPARFHVDVYEGVEEALNVKIECTTLAQVVQELERLVAQQGKRGKQARLALRLVNRCNILTIADKLCIPTDELIIEAARNRHFVVATNDSELRKRLRDEGIPVLYLRKKAYITLDGALTV